jgi:hypothetical protein
MRDTRRTEPLRVPSPVGHAIARSACVGTSGYGSIRIGIGLGAWLPLPFDAADLGAFQGQIVH